MSLALRTILVLSFSVALNRAADWPQFLGPARNGTSSEKIASSWEESAPKVRWRKTVGEGFSGPIASGDTVLLFHRREGFEVLEAFSRTDGASKWQNKERTEYRDDFGFDPGPRAVPALAGDRVYAMGAEGLVRCVELREGKTVWTVSTKDQFHARKGFFGMVCSPLVDGTNVILNVGGDSGAGIIALDKETGRLRWKARDDEASYSSPVFAALDGETRLIAFTREALCVLNPMNGHQLAEYRWRSRMEASVNAATPLVKDDLIFVTASYGTGAALFQWKINSLHKVWSNDESLSAHYATPVLYEDYIYGFHGRQEYGPALRCIELRSGKVMWSQEQFGAGTVTAAGGNLLVLKESGELVMFRASSEKFSMLGSCQILGSGVRAYPALSGKMLFARDKRALVAVDLP